MVTRWRLDRRARRETGIMLPGIPKMSGPLRHTMTIGVLVVLLTLAMPPSIGQGGSVAPVLFISPAPGVALPIGQAIIVRYRAVSPATQVELWVDDTRLLADRLLERQEREHSWSLTAVGPHCLTLRVVDERGARVIVGERRIVGLPRAARVRLDLDPTEPCPRRPQGLPFLLRKEGLR